MVIIDIFLYLLVILLWIIPSIIVGYILFVDVIVETKKRLKQGMSVIDIFALTLVVIAIIVALITPALSLVVLINFAEDKEFMTDFETMLHKHFDFLTKPIFKI